LESMGVSSGDIYTLPSLAYDAMEAYRNDVMLVAPGAYAETVELAWDLNNTHAMGLAGPTSFNDYSEPGVSIYTTTAAVAETVDLTGNYCQFHGINFANNGADTGNLAAFNVDGYSARFKGCSFHGVMNSTQNGVVAAAALYIDGLGSWYDFEDCVIGDDNWTVRTDALSSQLRYVSAANYPDSQHGRFKDCRFRLRSETATCAMVAMPGQYAVDRIHEFIRCTFTNHSVNWVNTLNQVFYSVSNQMTNTILLTDCTQSGFDEWQDSDEGSMFMANMAAATATGAGKAVEPTA